MTEQEKNAFENGVHSFWEWLDQERGDIESWQTDKFLMNYWGSKLIKPGEE